MTAQEYLATLTINDSKLPLLKDFEVIKRRTKSGKMKIHQLRCLYDDCYKTFNKRSSLFSHLNAHLGLKTVKCTWPGCSFSTDYDANLCKHIKCKHRGIKEYICERCGHAFQTSFNLRVHAKIHKRGGNRKVG